VYIGDKNMNKYVCMFRPDTTVGACCVCVVCDMSRFADKEVWGIVDF